MFKQCKRCGSKYNTMMVMDWSYSMNQEFKHGKHRCETEKVGHYNETTSEFIIIENHLKIPIKSEYNDSFIFLDTMIKSLKTGKVYFVCGKYLKEIN